MPREGTWSITSESDPRWNGSGRDFWDCVSGVCPNAQAWIDQAKRQIGKAPPDDLMYSFFKD